MTPDEFSRWLDHNPRIWQKYCEVVDEMIEAGYTRISSDMVCHFVRFALREKVDNYATSFLAREYARRFPHRRHLFEFRACMADIGPSPQMEFAW